MKFLAILFGGVLGVSAPANTLQPQDGVNYTILLGADLDVLRRDELWVEITTLARGQGTGYAQSRGDRIIISLSSSAVDAVRTLEGVHSVEVEREIAAGERRAYIVTLDRERPAAARERIAHRIWRLGAVEGDETFEYRAERGLITLELLPATAEFVKGLPGVAVVHEDVQFGSCGPDLEIRR